MNINFILLFLACKFYYLKQLNAFCRSPFVTQKKNIQCQLILQEQQEQLYHMINRKSQRDLVIQEDKGKKTNGTNTQKRRHACQKLMIFEVLTSKFTIITQLSAEANKISKKALGTNVLAINSHPNSNLRAFSYVFINALCRKDSNLYKNQSIDCSIAQLKQSGKQITSYILSQKFNIQQMFQIFQEMHQKCLTLMQLGLQIFEIIKAYSLYLELTSFILRSILLNFNFPESGNCQKKLATNQVYLILSQYFDLSYVLNKDIYLFPDLKIFIASPDDRQFVFGKYYENIDELQKCESQIRQSTIQHINQMNDNYQNMTISKMNLNVTMSGIAHQKQPGASNIYENKAPTPEFNKQVFGFQQLIQFNQNENNSNKLFGPSNLKVSKQIFDQLINQELNFVKKQHHDLQQMYSPAFTTATAINKNNVDSIFYLHQFDFYRKLNPQNNIVSEKMCSQRILLKGSSMVDQGGFFLQNIERLKRQKQNQLIQKQINSIEKGKVVRKDLQQTISAHSIGYEQEPKCRNHSSHSYDPKNQKSNSKCRSSLSKKTKSRLTLQSDVYRIKIRQKQENRKNDEYQKQSSCKSNTNMNSINKQKYRTLKNVRTQNYLHQPVYKKVNRSKSNKRYGLKYKIGDIPLMLQPWLTNQNHNHIHIHIHNDREIEPQNKSNKNRDRFAYKNGEVSYDMQKIQYLQKTFEQTIPKIVKQIENNSIHQQFDIKRKIRTQFGCEQKKYRKFGQITKKILQNKDKIVNPKYFPGKSNQFTFKQPNKYQFFPTAISVHNNQQSKQKKNIKVTENRKKQIQLNICDRQRSQEEFKEKSYNSYAQIPQFLLKKNKNKNMEQSVEQRYGFKQKSNQRLIQASNSQQKCKLENSKKSKSKFDYKYVESNNIDKRLKSPPNKLLYKNSRK